MLDYEKAMELYFELKNTPESSRGHFHPSTLSRIDVPVLLSESSETKAWFKDSVRYRDSHLSLDAKEKGSPCRFITARMPLEKRSRPSFFL